MVTPRALGAMPWLKVAHSCRTLGGLSTGVARDSRRHMATEARTRHELPQKVRRALELVYEVEGVVAARVWHWPGRMAVGVRGSNATTPSSLLRSVESAVAGLQEPGEAWDFGILDESVWMQVTTGH
jgi:hypothetical protein